MALLPEWNEQLGKGGMGAAGEAEEEEQQRTLL